MVFKTETISIKLTAEQKRKLDEKVKAEGLDRTKYIIKKCGL